MDAHVDPDPVCKRFLEAYSWDGTQCQRIPCGCQGSDCDALFPSADACDHAYRACYADRGVSRACTVHADCAVQARSCCAACSGTDDPGEVLMATRADAPSLRDAGRCVGDPQGACDDCEPFPYYSVYAACIEAECRLLDVSAHAACEVDADCQLTTKDCCACGGDFSSLGMVSVDASFTLHDHCSDVPCLECAGGQASDVVAVCREGVCAVGLLPI
jgi:hypothetical protein